MHGGEIGTIANEAAFAMGYDQVGMSQRFQVKRQGCRWDLHRFDQLVDDLSCGARLHQESIKVQASFLCQSGQGDDDMRCPGVGYVILGGVTGCYFHIIRIIELMCQSQWLLADGDPVVMSVIDPPADEEPELGVCSSPSDALRA